MCKLKILFNMYLMFLLMSASAYAQPTVCAEVKLEIRQEITVEREAFDAELGLTNNLTGDSLSNIRIDVEFRDQNGNLANNMFFSKVTNLNEISAITGSGVISPSKKATVNWLIIPKTDAGGTDPAGLKYAVRAIINYTVADKPFTYTTWDDWITVKPQPKFVMDYILPYDVKGDDPLTPETEPIEPYYMAVRVHNVGFGTGRNFKIASAQPKIVSNDKGLLIDFKIIGSWVNGEPSPNSLIVELGDIPPGGCSVAAWEMTCSLSGRFTEFEASYTHSAELGGEATSLIVEVNTHFMTKDIVADTSESDTIPDFLVDIDGDKNPDTIFESDCTDTPVSLVSAQISGSPTVEDPTASITVDNPSGWLCINVNDPAAGTGMEVAKIVRSDGKIINSRNFWQKDDKIYFVDYYNAIYEYTVVYNVDVLDETPPVTEITIQDPKYGTEPVYVGTITTFTLTATDDISGVVATWYKIEPPSPPEPVEFGTYGEPFDLAELDEGEYTITYYSVDKMGNTETAKILAVSMDKTPSAIPAGLAAEVIDSNNVKLTWGENTETDLAGYNIYRSASPFVKINTELVTTNSYNDTTVTGGAAYKYAVTSVDTVCNESAFQEIPVEVEFVPPAAINNLAAEPGSTPQEINLSWTAVGDDGMDGQAAKYDIRYSKSNIDDTNFLQATSAVQNLVPKVSGSAELFTVVGLESETKYYFAVKTIDDAENESSISNVPFATTVQSMPQEASINVTFTPNYQPPLPQEASINVTFTPNYQPPLPQEASINVTFTPNYQPPMPQEDTIAVSFTPSYKIYTVSSEDGFVTLESNNPGMSIVSVSEIPPAASQAILDADLNPVSLIYDIAPSGTSFTPPATLIFTYEEPDPETPTENGYKIYAYDEDTTSWIPLAEQVIDIESNSIIAPRDHVSLYGLFVKGDTLPPRTDIAAGEPNYVTATSTYVTLQNQFSLSAIDDLVTVGDGIGMGVKETLFSINNSTFNIYTGPFGLIDPSSIPQIPENCAGLWKFDEGSGITASDSSGNGNNGTITGAIWSDGIKDKALSFDGVNNYMDIPQIQLTNQFTFECWANYTRENETVAKTWVAGLIAGLNGVLNGESRILIRSDRIIVNLQISGNYDGHTAMIPITKNTWHHYGVTYDGVEVKIYFDGTEVYSGAQSGTLDNGGSPIRIGSGATGYYWDWYLFEGKIDEAGLYSRALTQEEITQRYAGDAPPITEGQYEISYRSTDILDNMESTKTATVILDETPPVTEFTISGPYVNIDPPTGEGVIEIGTYDINESTEIYSVNGSSPVYVPEGYELVFSTNPGHMYLVPVGTGGSAKPAGKWVNFINSDTELILTAEDTYSGVKNSRWQIADSGWQDYIESISLSGEDGLYKIEYRSEDNLSHLEVIKSTEVYLDNTAPTTALKIENVKYEIGNTIYVSTLTQFTITADDGNGCGVEVSKWRIANGLWQEYTGAFNLADVPEGEEGEYEISYYSTDLLDKEESVKTLTVLLDKTPPETQLNVAQPSAPIEESGLQVGTYVTLQTSFTLTATDPLLNSGQTPSGIRDTRWRIDENDWQSYEEPFTLLSLPSAPGIPHECISMWKFDEGVGTTALDTVDGNHGTVIGATWVDEGKEGKALSFDGINDYTDMPSIQLTNQFTFECWANYTRTDETGKKAYAGLISGINGVLNDESRIVIRSDRIAVLLTIGGNYYYHTAMLPITKNTWHHYGVTYNGSQIKIYFDGTEVYSGAQSGVLDNGGYPTRIGSGATEQYWDWYLFEGKIDEAGLYSRALAQEEISQRYTGVVPPAELAEGEHTLSYYSADNVNNKETVKSETLILDNTAPEINIVSPLGGEQFVATINTINIDFDVTDLSPVATTAYLTLVECVDGDKIGETYEVQSGTEVEPLNLPYYGMYTLTVEATDCLGHKTSTETANFEVIWDKQPPRTEVQIGVPRWEMGEETYVTIQTTYSLIAVDDLVTVGDGIGLGVKETLFSINNSTFNIYTGTFGVVDPSSIPQIPANCKGLWKFEEGVATTAGDTVDGNHGTIVGATWVNEGKEGKALSFDGNDDYVEVPYIPVTTQVTYECWFNYTRSAEKEAISKYSWAGLIAGINGTYYGDNRVLINSGAILVQFYMDNIYISQYVTLPITRNTWHHLAFTYDGSAMKLYLDGQLVDSKPQSGVIKGEGYQGRIGAGAIEPQWWDWYLFEGKIDEAGLYSRALTQEEITQRYAGAPPITEGQYEISYRSIDVLDNTEETKIQTVILDETPPVTEFTLNGNFVNIDPPTGEGVIEIGTYDINESTEIYSVNGSSPIYVPPGYELAFSTNPGHIYLVPVGTGGTSKPAGKWVNFITSETELVLTAVDTYSGVKETKFRIPDSEFQIYEEPSFTLSGEDGLYKIEYRSEDNLSHLEVTKSTEVYLDNTAPVSQLSVQGSEFIDNGNIYVSTLTQFTITADDGNGCGVSKIQFKVDSSEFIDYTTPFTLHELPEGEHTISYYSTDLLDKEELVKTQMVILDKTPPVTILTSAEPKYESAEQLYVTLQTSFTLTATDPLLNSGQTPSGVKTTSWRIDDKDWIIYEDSFTLLSLPSTPGIPPGCISMWKFDEGSGTTAFDTAGANDGTLVGATWTPGKEGSALNFDGTGKYVNIAHSPNLNINLIQSKTIEFWANISVTQDNMIIYKQAGWVSGAGYSIVIDAVPRVQAILQDNSRYINMRDYSTGTNIVPGMWNHITLVVDRDNNVATLYVNGEIELTAEITGFGSMENTLPLRIGGPIWDGAKGKIDEVAIYDRALTAVEIMQRYTGVVPPVELAEGEHTLSYYSADNVNNKETIKSETLILDNTSPEVTISSPMGGEQFIANISSITINYSVSDNLDPAPKVNAYLTDLEEGTTVAVFNGGVIDPISIDDGFWKLTVEAEDCLGHKTSTETARFEVIWDILPPRTELQISDPRYQILDTTYISSNTEISLSAEDDLIEVEDGIGLGVEKIQYSIDDLPITDYQLPFTLSEGGPHTISYYSVDIIGNTESTRTYHVIVDTAPPCITSLHVAPEYISPNNDNVQDTATVGYELDEQAYVTAYICNSAGSVIKNLIDNQISQPGQHSVAWDGLNVSDGEYTYVMGAVDMLGNPSSASTCKIVVDTVATEIISGNVYPVPFNPWVGETVTLFNEISEPSYVTLNITDGSDVEIQNIETNSIKPAGAFGCIWDGKAAGNCVDKGFYGWNISIVDLAGNSASETFTGKIEVADPKMPAVSNIVITPDPFTPDGTDLVISYTLHLTPDNPPKLPATVDIVHPIDGVVKTIRQAQYDGVNYVQWDGVNKKHQIVEDGVYKVVVSYSAPPPAPNSKEGTFVVTRNNSQTVTYEDVTVLYQPGVAVDITKIDEPSTEIALSIQSMSAQGNYIASDIYDIDVTGMTSGMTPITVYFDYDPAYYGESLALFKYNGTDWVLVTINYFVDTVNNRLIAMILPDELAASPYALFRVVDTAAPSVTSVSVSPPIISPNEDGQQDDTILSFELSDNIIRPLKVTVCISDSGGNVIKVFAQNVAMLLGTQQIAWDGKDGLGNYVAAGIYTFKIDAKDVMGNSAATSTVNVSVDLTPPVSQWAAVSGPREVIDGKNYITSQTEIGLSAEDPVVSDVSSGVKEIQFRIWSANGGAEFGIYDEPFKITGDDGSYTVEYYSVDNVSNKEDNKSVIVYVDNKPPVTEISLSNPKYDFENNIWISSETIVSLSAVDVGEVSCGVKYIEYKIDSAAYSIYIAPFDLSALPAGEHTIYYRSYDNLLNCEAEKSVKVIIDNSEPETYVLATEPKYNDYVTSESTFSFVAVDSGTIPSGIKETKYRINPPETEEFANYVSIFNITGTDGIYTVEYYSTDNVDNVEVVRDIAVKLDNTKPATQLSVQGSKFIDNGKTYITPQSEIVLSAEDPIINSVASGVKEIKYSVDNLPITHYQSPITLTEGIHTVQYYAIDNLINTEATNNITIYIDGTAPVTEINIGEPKYEAFGRTVISPNTPLTLTAVDPVAANVASQVKVTEYRVNGGDFVTYTGTFTLTEGAYTVEYRSIDNVENTEELKSITLTVTYISEYAAFSAGAMNINGNGEVYGNIRGNDQIDLSGNAQIDGDVSGDTVEVSGNKVKITGEVTENAPAVNPDVIDMEAIVEQVSQNNDNGNIPAKSLKDGVLKLNSGSLTLSSGTYYLAGIELAGKSKLYFEGKVNIVCTGDIHVAGQSEVHHSGNPYDLVIYCSTTSTIHISGQGEFQSVIYAPYSEVFVTGQGITLSNVFAKQLSISGNGKIVGVGYSSGTIVAAGPKMLTAPQADPTFVVGEVYSYPNPAKRGACPTLHIECGLADSLEIRIYNIAAELVDSVELYNQPSVVNGKYAYEYTWNISDIASGVYIYVIRANKNGFGTIKATGKAAVIK